MAPTRKKPLDEKKRKRIIGEELEKLDVLGQESDKKAVKHVQAETKRIALEEKKKEDETLEKLDSKKKWFETYVYMLCKELHDMVVEVGLPKSVSWGVWFDGKGIVLAIRDKKKHDYRRAFAVVQDPKYDLNACLRFAIWADEVRAKIESPDVWTPGKAN